MLQPTRTKYRKAHKGRIHGKASRANIMNYGAYGLIGVKVWIYKGEIFEKDINKESKENKGNKNATTNKNKI